MERTRAVVDQEYTNHAFALGHKSRLVAQYQDEMDEHLDELKKLNRESVEMTEKEKAEKENDAPAKDIRTIDAEVIS